MKDRIYALIHHTEKLAYIGRTYQTVDDRIKQHLVEALNSSAVTKKLERLRHDLDSFSFIELTDGRSEHEWMEEYRSRGFELLNSTGGNRAAPKARSERPAWKERPIFVATSRTGVGLKSITQAQYEEMRSLPTAEARFEFIQTLRSMESPASL